MIATKIWLSVVTRLLMSIIFHIIYIENPIEIKTGNNKFITKHFYIIIKKFLYG
jgi:hypothetical protein